MKIIQHENTRFITRNLIRLWKPLGNWLGHGEILSVTFKNGNGDICHWSQTNGTLDSQGNHITQNGGIFNINTGVYKEPIDKAKQEWDETRKTLKKSSGIHF